MVDPTYITLRNLFLSFNYQTPPKYFRVQNCLVYHFRVYLSHLFMGQILFVLESSFMGRREYYVITVLHYHILYFALRIYKKFITNAWLIGIDFHYNVYLPYDVVILTGHAECVRFVKKFNLPLLVCLLFEQLLSFFMLR